MQYFFRTAVLTAGLALAFSGTGRAQQNPIIIGGTLALTGPFAEPSADYKYVYDRWLKDVNARGGLLGRPVKMVIYNDESKPTVAQALYNKLLDQDQADLILAPYTTYVGATIVPLVLNHNKLLFNGGFTGIAIFEDAKGRMIGSYPYQEPEYTRGLFEMIQSLPAADRPKRLAIFTSQNPFSVVNRSGFNGKGGALNYAKAADVEVVLDELYPPSTTDFAGLVRKAKAANADLVLALSLPNDTLNIARSMRQLNFKPKIFCTCGAPMTTLSSWPKLGSAGEDAFGQTFSWPTQEFEGIRSLAADFEARGQQTIPGYAISGYAILQVIEQAVEGARTLDQDQLKGYIESHTFRTVAGNLTFGKYGMPSFNQVVIQFRNGRNEVVWPEAFKTANPQLN